MEREEYSLSLVPWEAFHGIRESIGRWRTSPGTRPGPDGDVEPDREPSAQRTITGYHSAGIVGSMQLVLRWTFRLPDEKERWRSGRCDEVEVSEGIESYHTVRGFLNNGRLTFQAEKSSNENRREQIVRY